MNKIKNTQGIRLIIMNPVAYNVCDIGGDTYKSELEVTFAPKHYYPDYMEVQQWIAEHIDNKRLNIEDVVSQVYDFLMREYEPLELEVRSDIKGCRTHFNVTVIK